MLSVSTDGSVTLAGPEGGLTAPTGQAAIYQLWRKTIDGFIVRRYESEFSPYCIGLLWRPWSINN